MLALKQDRDQEVVFRWISILFFLHSITYFFILINYEFVYWDDWVLYKSEFISKYEMFSDAGAPYVAYMHRFMLDTFGVYGYRVLTFFYCFFSSIFLLKILMNIGRFNNRDAFLIAVFFSIAPLNDARIALINSFSLLSYFLFFCAFFFLSEYLKRPAIWKRIFSLCLFFVSFIAKSLLVFYLIVFLYVLIWFCSERNSKKIIFFKIMKFSDYWVLPFSFYFIHDFLFKAQGLYSNYNTLAIGRFLKALWTSFLFIFTNLFELFLTCLEVFQSFVGFFLFVLLVLLLLFLLKNVKFINCENPIVAFGYLCLGVFFSYLAIFPYAAVGKFFANTFFDWQSRTQLLLPLGYAFVFVSIIKCLQGWRGGAAIRYVVVGLVAVFVVKNNSYYLDYIVDGFKQDAIVYALKDNSTIKSGRTFLFNDNTQEYSANNRYLRFYELSGLSYVAFGDQCRLIITEDYVKGRLSRVGLKDFISRFEGLDRVSLADYRYTPPSHRLEFNIKNNNYISNISIFKLFIDYYFDKERYYRRIDEIFEIKVYEIDLG